MKKFILENLIARVDGTSDYDQPPTNDWFLETRWEYDTTSDKDLFIICQFKVVSNDEVTSSKLHIILDLSHMSIEKGEITHISGESNDNPVLTDQRLKELKSTLPSPKRTGPQINLNMNTTPKLAKYECEGESSIRMALGNTNTINTYQSGDYCADGMFNQNFAITHIIFSKKPTVLPEILQQKRSAPADKPISVANLTVFYQIHDGGWRECEDIAIAPVALRNEEPKWLNDTIINIEPGKLLSFTIRGRMVLKGDLAGSPEILSRIHKSLPQPLKLKIVVTDNYTKQSSLIIESLNGPLELITRESFLKTNQSSIVDLLAFVYADDCENDERVFMGMFIDTKNRLFIRKYDNFWATYDRKALRMLEYNAKKDKTTEVPLNEAHYQQYAREHKAIALFDSESYLFYAVRLEVSTKTSKTEETVIIPTDKIK
jgi:hypothetical protein